MHVLRRTDLVGIVGIVAIAAIVTAGLGCGSRPDATDSALVTRRSAYTDPPAPADSFCVVGNERIALRCSGRTARRAGDTLAIRMTTGRDTTFVNRADSSDQAIQFEYAGRVAAPLHVIWVHYDASIGAKVFDARSGAVTEIPDLPVVSPDSERFAAASLSLDVCEGNNAIGIWRIGDGTPVPEFSWTSAKCGSDATWGPGALKWRSRDTLEITRIANDKARTQRPIFLVRRDTTWEFFEPIRVRER